MSTDIFLKVDGVTGESKDARHQGWIQIECSHLVWKQEVAEVRGKSDIVT